MKMRAIMTPIRSLWGIQNTWKRSVNVWSMTTRSATTQTVNGANDVYDTTSEIQDSEIHPKDLAKQMYDMIYQKKTYDQAISMYEDGLKREDFAPRTNTFNLYLRAKSKSNESVDELLGLVQQGRSMGVRLNARTFNILVEHSLVAGEIGKLFDSRFFRFPRARLRVMLEAVDVASNYRYRTPQYPLQAITLYKALRTEVINNMDEVGIPEKNRYEDVYNKVVTAAVRRGRLKFLKDLITPFEKENQIKLYYQTTANWMLKAAAFANPSIADAYRELQQKHSETISTHVKLDEGTALQIINTAGKHRNIALAEFAFNHLESFDKRPPRPAIFYSLIQLYSMERKLEESLSMLNLFDKYHPGRGSPFLMMNLVSLFAGKSSREVRQRGDENNEKCIEELDRVFDVLLQRKNDGEGMSVTPLNILILACGKSGELGRAFETFESMEEMFEIKPNVHTYNCLMESCLHCGRWSAVLKLKRELFESGLEPDIKTCFLLLDASLYSRNVHLILENIKTFEAHGHTIALPKLNGVQNFLYRNFKNIEESDDRYHTVQEIKESLETMQMA